METGYWKKKLSSDLRKNQTTTQTLMARKILKAISGMTIYLYKKKADDAGNAWDTRA
jgi:hypothetical protein